MEPLSNSQMEQTADPFGWFDAVVSEASARRERFADYPREQLAETAIALVGISDRARAAAKAMLLAGIQQEIMSKRRASRILKVHQKTITRWVNAEDDFPEWGA
jgi:hypothetical protein